MNGYTKLFADIITSSIWNEDDQTRVIWITLLALSNADGFVSGVPTSLAVLSRVPLEKCKIALNRLTSPDPESRTKEHDGRRIMEVEGGWLILNYPKYRERISDDPHAVAARERQRKHREKVKSVTESVTSRHPASASVSVSSSPEGGAGGNELAYPSQPQSNPLVVVLRERFSELFQRPPSQRWSYLEESALLSVAKVTNQAEIDMVCAWFNAQRGDDMKYRPQSIQSILEGWGRCLDRARGEKTQAKKAERKRTRIPGTNVWLD